MNKEVLCCGWNRFLSRIKSRVLYNTLCIVWAMVGMKGVGMHVCASAWYFLRCWSHLEVHLFHTPFQLSNKTELCDVGCNLSSDIPGNLHKQFH